MFSGLFIVYSFVSLAIVSGVTCPNACSGHGTCGANFVCECYDNYGMGLSHDSGDCSDRICPYELAWVDTPDVNGRRHKYTECASKGICNRDSGECECFAGYEGKACQRASCPNDCSGHGRCSYIEDLSYAPTPLEYFGENLVNSWELYTYHQWDASKTRGCVCDPGFADIDCSKRICNYGTDIMDHRLNMLSEQKYHTQKIQLVAEDASTGFDGKSFSITFRSKLNETFTTLPIQIKAYCPGCFGEDIQKALMNLPNGVIDGVSVNSSFVGTSLSLSIVFTGESVQGPQNRLSFNTNLCGDGCTPKQSGLELHPLALDQTVTETVLADFNSYECGRRGKCDYSTGNCECFDGYTGVSCSVVAALI